MLEILNTSYKVELKPVSKTYGELATSYNQRGRAANQTLGSQVPYGPTSRFTVRLPGLARVLGFGLM